MLLRLSTIIFLASVLSKGIHSSETKQQKPFIPPNPEYNMFGGISTFAHVPYENCWDQNAAFDIAFLGIPFDTLTSFRPGARFGSAAIREGSRRTKVCGGFNTQLGMNPFTTDLKIVDCGDLQLDRFNNDRAIKEMQKGYQALLYQNPHNQKSKFPRVIALGGDHTITLPILRSIHAAYGPVSVIHFDSHLDTWSPYGYYDDSPDEGSLNHGTYFYYASEEGLIKKGESIHAGIRSPLVEADDYKNDDKVGFTRIDAREIDEIGAHGIIERIRKTVGNNYVYLSLDIDVLDPSYAPGTGTPETGGWTTRELRRILRGLDGLNIVGADLVEVSPPYDTNAQITALAAADCLYEILTIMVKNPLH